MVLNNLEISISFGEISESASGGTEGLSEEDSAQSPLHASLAEGLQILLLYAFEYCMEVSMNSECGKESEYPQIRFGRFLCVEMIKIKIYLNRVQV